MIYLVFKAAHVAAVVTWLGGMLMLAVLLPLAARDGAASAALLDLLRRWDRRVTLPAMVAAWSLGLGLALTAGWFPSGWLLAKLVLVLALSGLHGVQSGKLRRLAGDDAAVSAPNLARMAWLLPALALPVLLLAVAKPL